MIRKIYGTEWGRVLLIQSFLLMLAVAFGDGVVCCNRSLCRYVGSGPSFRPVAPVKVSISDSLGYVLAHDVFGCIKVCNGTCHFQYAAIGTCGELQAFHGKAKQGMSFVVKGAMFVKQFLGHLRIAVYSGYGGEAGGLDATGMNYTLTYDGTGFSRSSIGDLVERERQNLALYVYPVHEGAADLVEIFGYLPRSAHTCFGRMVEISAGAGIHGRHEHEITGIVHRSLYAADGYVSVFERLSEHLESLSLEFGKFIGKKDSIVCQRYFSRLWIGSSAHKGRLAYGVVRASEWACGNERAMPDAVGTYGRNL